MTIATAAPLEAQTNPQQADALFREGRRLMASGRIEEACAKFQASNQAEASVGALLNLGDCQLRRDDPTAAWLALRRAELLALTLGDNERAGFARNRKKRVGKRLGFVTLSIAERWRRAPDLSVVIDGRRLVGPEIDRLIPLSPGSHELEIRAGDGAFARTLEGKAGVTVLLEVDLEPAAPPAGLAAAVSPRVDPGDDRESGTSRREVFGISMAAGGGAAVVVGVTVGILARSQWNGVKACRDVETPACTADEIARGDAAELKANVATGLFVGGALVAGAGLALWLTAPEERPRGDAVAWAPVVNPGFLGMAASGRF